MLIDGDVQESGIWIQASNQVLAWMHTDKIIEFKVAWKNIIGINLYPRVANKEMAMKFLFWLSEKMYNINMYYDIL